MRWGDKKESDRKESVRERKKEKESTSSWDRVRKREQEARNYHKQNIQQQPQQSSAIIKKHVWQSENLFQYVTCNLYS